MSVETASTDWLVEGNCVSSTLKAGGGSSATTWAVHSQCDRYRGTDPLVLGKSRRALAKELGHPDSTAGIPDARWTRAMIFERLCHDLAFASEVTTRATGWSGFARPTGVVRVDCGVSTAQTTLQLEAALARVHDGTATLLSKLAVPYPGFEEGATTNVLPDLAVVALGPSGPSLIVGDVKDYERVRSRIDDGRLLKGFLQVAMGAFALQRWDGVPEGLNVSTHGFLAVPRSVFLQPTVEVEDISDHLAEVESQWADRLAARPLRNGEQPIAEYVASLPVCFDPVTCPSCSLSAFCQGEVRASTAPEALLVELGVPENEWPSLLPLLNGGQPGASAKPSTAARVRATVSGEVQNTGLLRVDPVGSVGVVNVVVVKSDAAALGFHGVGVSRETANGPTDWNFEVFPDPQADETRRKVMSLIGKQIELAMGENRKANPSVPAPMHLVVPDGATADLLASTADSLAGVELSRLRWKRDLAMGRPALTYDGEPAVVPKSLEGSRRTAVSFLLEQDRARMLKLRQPVVALTDVLAKHFVPGGAEINARRLDYLVRWVTAEKPVDHRAVADEIAATDHTPGARMANNHSNVVTAALQQLRRTGEIGPYEDAVRAELEYKAAVVDASIEVLDELPDSRLQPAYRSLEGDAQKVWRRRMELRASDLVRFGRTYAYWRNQLTEVIQDDEKCWTQLAVLTDPTQARERANDPGDRFVAWAEVIKVAPLTLKIASRRFTDGERVMLVATDEGAWVETADASVTLQAGAIKLRGFCLGPLDAKAGQPDALPRGEFVWSPHIVPQLEVGDRVVVARRDWFKHLQSKTDFNVNRPKQDDQAAPKTACDAATYLADPDGHRWCCKPHELVEADFADELALRRARNELNPEVWPPVRDEDGFEVAATGKPTSRTVTVEDASAPEGVTIDELE